MAPATATPRPTTIWGPPTKTASFSTHVGVVRKSGKKQSANNGRVHRWAGRNGVNGSYGPIEIGAQERNRARTKTPERVVSEKRRKDKHMTDHTYTVAHLRDPRNRADLRLLAGKILNPNAWRHIVPDPATGSLPDIAEQLLRQVVANDRLPELEDVILAYPLLCNAMGFVNPYRELLLLSPTDRAICCLLVLLPAKVIVE